MDRQIEIKYRHLPSDLFVDIENAFRNNDISINIFPDKEDYENFDGSPADILIYINQHLTELIITGLISPAIYDLVKHSISSTWKKIRDYYLKKKNRLEEEKNYISLNFKIDSDNSVEFNLIGDIKEDKISELTDKLFAYISDTNRIQNDLNNPDFKSSEINSNQISLRFNFESNKWEPINYAELRKQMDNFLNDLYDKLEN